MALNDQILDELKKALNKVQATAMTRQTWQEPFDRQPVVSPDHIQAAKALEGFAGSWAAQAAIAPSSDELLTYAQEDGVFVPQLVTSHLGRPGVPEVNFPLYARGTNKDDEPAFLGHPISFSIVGPTLRHKTNNWQWVYGVNGSGEETLTLDTETYDNSFNIGTSIDEIFGISSVPDSGLYFVVSATGAPAKINDGVLKGGGVGDNYVRTVGLRSPIKEKTDPVTGELLRSARYEIFRINDISGTPNIFVLDKNKRLSDYFDIPSTAGITPVVRSITLFKPYVTRLASVPNSEGAGKNKVFLTVTPEVSANGDLYPAYGAGTGSDKTWLGGNFTDYDTNLEAPADAYGGEAKLPIYTPKGKGLGRIATNRYQNTAPTPADGLPFEAGVLKITDYTGVVAAGDVLCIHNVSQMTSDYGEMHTVYEGFNPSRGKHYYEVLSTEMAPIRHLRCKALPQVDTNGNIFYGPVVMDATIDLDGTPVAATGGVQIKGTGPVSANTNYTVTITIDRVGFSQAYTVAATATVDDSLAIVNKLAAAITLSLPPFVVSASAFGVGDDATVKLIPTSGIYGNWIGISVSASPPLGTDPLMYVSGSRLGTDVGKTVGYNSTFAPAPQVRGHGIGKNKYFLQANYTIHDNVSALWQGPFDAAKVQANRLANLIDPTWSRNALSTLHSVVSSQVAVAAGRADKAIFDTSMGTKGAANPGSLLDLGFRMVLYPAKDDGGGNAVPDWDKPITTQNVVLDPTISESQYLYIDYASGAVVFSHTPDPTSSSCSVAPNGIIGGAGTNNPRGDIVLFAACVPFSRMPDQTAGGLRLMSTQTVKVPTATTSSNSYADEGIGSQDVLGERTTYSIAGVFAGVPQTLNSQTVNQQVYLIDTDTVAYGSSLKDNGPTITVLVLPTIGVDTLTFWLGTTAYQITLTAAAAAGTNNFVVGVSTAATAGNIADKINSDPRINQVMHATWDGVTSDVYVYSRRVGAQVDTSDFFPFAYAEAAPFRVYSSNTLHLALAGGSSRTELSSIAYTSVLPQSGWFDVVESLTGEPALKFTDPDNIVRRVATFSYGSKELVWDAVAGELRTRLNNVFGGGAILKDIDLSAARYSLVLRKADVLPNDPKGNTGTPFQLDTTEGSSARFSKIRFAQGTLGYSGGLLTLDLAGDFVKKRGDTMSGALTIAIDTALNPTEANKTGLTATGNGTGYGIKGTNGAGGLIAVLGFADPATNAIGVYGQGAGLGVGVGGVGEAGSSSAGVAGAGGTPNGNGVQGLGQGTGVGVKGEHFSNGNGVEGEGGSITGSSGGIGVKGTGGKGVGGGTVGGIGVYGQGASGVAGDGIGVYGIGGRTADGVYGQSGGSPSVGVRGVGTSGRPGVRGEGNGVGAGVEGIGNNGYGVFGTGGAAGVRGESLAGSFSNGGSFLGDMTGAGLDATGGAAGGAGGVFTGGAAGGNGLQATGDTTGAGVVATGGASGVGVDATGSTTGAGVSATGARGLVASSNAIANYPQAQLTAQGLALPVNKAKGDLWFPNANGAGGQDWGGHLLIYDGSNYLDAYSAIMSTHLIVAQTGGFKAIGSWTLPTGGTNLLGDQSDIVLSPTTWSIASSGPLLFGDVIVTVTVPFAIPYFSAGDYVYIAGAADANINNTATYPAWRVVWVDPVGGNQFAIAPPAGVGGLAGGTVKWVAKHPMDYMRYNQTAGGAQNFKFQQVYHLPNSFKAIPTTGSDPVFTVYHGVNTTGATNTTWKLGVVRYRPTEGYPIVKDNLVSGSFVGGTAYTAKTELKVSVLTALITGFGTAQPFQAGDVVAIYLIVTGNANGSDWYIYDTEFNFSEAYYAKY